MALETFHHYQHLYEEFFSVRFKPIPIVDIVEDYDLVAGSVRIHENASRWYFFIPERLTEWELFVLLETKQWLSPNTEKVVIRNKIKELTTRKGIAEARAQHLYDLFMQVTCGYGLLEVLLGDAKLKAIRIHTLNKVSTVKVDIEHYGECNTNLLFTKEFIDTLSKKLRHERCAGLEPCSIRIGDIPVSAHVKDEAGQHLHSRTIKIKK
ncbi:hypothetical protein GF342_00285 [Candidatus Woesearchaeota archaeon]|nr:hypothetical protein [Candidatus Woesearchaeota archaeon]